ncbi:MAG: RNA polymerase sigma factor (sigma-70 family) [Verrucomicrobiales bacterium]|jgi:RNA polymerase sigma factor (sigma-70 family)
MLLHYEMESSSKFPLTQWTLIQQMGSKEAAAVALAGLCQSYWYPVYSYVRRNGRSAHDAEDLTQSFFARMIASDGLALARSDRGRFRNFLLTALKRFLTDEYRKKHSLKRGGEQSLISIDQEQAETPFRHEPSETNTSQDAFERQWAAALLDKVYQSLQTEYRNRGKEQVYKAWKATCRGMQIPHRNARSPNS